MIAKLVDLLMGSSSPIANKSKKRVDIPAYQATSAIQLLVSLMNCKKNLKDYINPNKIIEGCYYENLTPLEK